MSVQSVRYAAWLMLGLGCGIALGAAKWRASAERFHRQARLAVILSQAQQMPKGGVLVIGDSIAERIWMPTLCGKPVLNAGISWSTSKDWLPDVREVIAAARPSVTVIETGANDKGRFVVERHELESLATFTVAAPSSTVDGVHPDARGAEQFRRGIETGCRQRP